MAKQPEPKPAPKPAPKPKPDLWSSDPPEPKPQIAGDTADIGRPPKK